MLYLLLAQIHGLLFLIVLHFRHVRLTKEHYYKQGLTEGFRNGCEETVVQFERLAYGALAKPMSAKGPHVPKQ